MSLTTSRDEPLSVYNDDMAGSMPKTFHRTL
jgi:hypothetical protein